jgi:hypothetical protein
MPSSPAGWPGSLRGSSRCGSPGRFRWRYCSAAPPGSGKTTTQGLVQMSLGVDRVAVYDLDDNAAAHPRYDAIMRARGIRGHDAVTQNLPPNLGLRCLEHVRGGDPKYDVVASAPLHLKDGTKIWVDGSALGATGSRSSMSPRTKPTACSASRTGASRRGTTRGSAGGWRQQRVARVIDVCSSFTFGCSCCMFRLLPGSEPNPARGSLHRP